jgi:alcohol dehydrogenase, propanol-preferring
MKAMILDRQAPIDQSPLRLGEIPRPEPGPGEVLIRVSVCGICRTDLHVIEGDLPARRMPLVPGHQVVGTVEALGTGVSDLETGQRVGVAWLGNTCGVCRFCRSDRENLCEDPAFTGWTRDGGFAEYIAAPAGFTYPLPDGFTDLQAAPLLCAGIIGYRALIQTGLGDTPGGFGGKSLGLYGFGAAGHVVIQLARARGVEVYVVTRDRENHQKLARELGAAWAGDPDQTPPRILDASIIFAPAGELVPLALAALDRGGRLILGGIHMSPTPPIPYDLLYQERVIRSVANNTRKDGHALMQEAARIPITTHVQTYALEDANRALQDLKHKAIRGEGVLLVGAGN